MKDFAFQYPGALLLLLLAPLLWWLLAYARRRRLAVVEAMGGGPTTHRFQRDLLRVAAFALLALALARPGYAPRLESTSRTGRDVVFVLDVSQSMLAEDVTPSRLEVAKQAVRDALKAMGTERVGLVVYAGSASVLCPLTYDYDFVRYMLEQAQPRTVDFGGTTLQAAIEKCADQVFMEGRGGMQDLIVLTDGGDQGSDAAKMVETLEEKQVDVLLVGLGDRDTGSVIPILDDEGKQTFLENDGANVTTKLDDEALRDFASKSGRVRYVAAGTQPFDLGLLYEEFSRDLPHDSADSGTGVRIYREAAIFLLIPAFLLLALAESRGARGWRIPWIGRAALLLALALPAQSEAAGFDAAFGQAVGSMKSGDYPAAEAQFSALVAEASPHDATPANLGVVQFNRGLCLLKTSESQAKESPALALATAREAQRAFLAARRSDPDLRRAGVRLETTAAVLASLQKLVEEQEKADRETNEALQKLTERLRAELAAQQALGAEVAGRDVPRRQPNRKRNQPPPPPIVAPPDAVEIEADFSRKQNDLETESHTIEEDMKSLHEKMRIPIPGVPPMASILTEPLRLMKNVEQAQASATMELKVWDTWPTARAHGAEAEMTLQAIIDLLAQNSAQEGESEEADEEMDEQNDYSETDDSDQSASDSSLMEGDFAGDSEMQELPVPNYSAEDILTQEQDSLQFRQQKRGKANAAKVEKDY